MEVNENMMSLQKHISFAGQLRTGWIACLILIPLFWGVSLSSAAWVLTGSTTVSGNDIIITQESGNQAGAAWLDTPIDLTSDFDITLMVNLGDRDSGADGLSIVLQNDPAGTGARGDTLGGGEWVGIHGIYPALAVEIDTYHNGDRGDLECDHLGINEIRNATSQPEHDGAGPQCADSSDDDIEDGVDHAIRLVWASSTRTLTIFWDGQPKDDLTYTNNIAADIFGGVSSVWFGVVGSTGGAYNQQQFRAVVDDGRLAVSKSALPTSVNTGDTVDYTITLQNSSSITAFVTDIEDQLPSGFSYRAGNTTGLTTSDPAISGQTIRWSGNWQVGPGQTAQLTFQVSSSATPGWYQNQATVRGANFSDVSTGPTADVTVTSGGSVPAFGTKPLYLHENLDLSRIAPPQQNGVRIGRRETVTWTLTPVLYSNLTINGDAGAIPVRLMIETDRDRRVRARLSTSSGILIGEDSIDITSSASIAAWDFAIPVTGDVSVPAGESILLSVYNYDRRDMFVHPMAGGEHSRVALEARTVINVDQITFYDAPYPGGTAITTASPGQTIHIRATVSDPFGSFDITSAALVLEDGAGNPVVGSPTPAPMTQVADSLAATKAYEFVYTLPTSAADSLWTARVTAEEGSEGLVRHTATATLQVASADIVLLKTVLVESDPVNGGTNPKAIPGAHMLYTLIATNQGGAATDGDTVVVTDPVPANTDFFVGDLGVPSSGPVRFIDGTTTSGLTYTYGGLADNGDDIAFSNNNGTSFDYTPVPDGLGFDSDVTHIRINPKGAFIGTSGGNVPSFQLRLRVKVR